jgi:hypothetical protein
MNCGATNVQLVPPPVNVAVMEPLPVALGAVKEVKTGVTTTPVDDAPVPTEFVAATVHVCATPFVRPLTVIGELVPLALNVPPAMHVTAYDVIGEPPSAGALNAIVISALPAMAEPMIGASGTVIGVTLFDGADAGLVPTAFVAVTVNV